jgi:hypothetical protein
MNRDVPVAPSEVFARLRALLGQMEELQKQKVIDLARRLKPGVTPEDIRNPHDFPELEDPDWHFADGQLTGIESVRFALRGLEKELGLDEQEDGTADQSEDPRT